MPTFFLSLFLPFLQGPEEEKQAAGGSTAAGQASGHDNHVS